MNRVAQAMHERGLNPTALARRAGISRQALYRMLDPEYDPFPSGFRAVAAALATRPERLVTPLSTPALEEIKVLAHDAASGDARAFELLPAALSALTSFELHMLEEAPEPVRRLLVAAADVLATTTTREDLRPWIIAQAARLSGTLAVFFGGAWMDPERLVAVTPPVLARHKLYGAFDMDSFTRHLNDGGPGAQA
jgi:lambda repressor-like predicted transcriptional regulator